MEMSRLHLFEAISARWLCSTLRCYCCLHKWPIRPCQRGNVPLFQNIVSHWSRSEVSAAFRSYCLKIPPGFLPRGQLVAEEPSTNWRVDSSKHALLLGQGRMNCKIIMYYTLSLLKLCIWLGLLLFVFIFTEKLMMLVLYWSQVYIVFIGSVK